MKQFADLYVNTSQGPGDTKGPWNTGEQWEKLDEIEESIPLDGGDGMASVKLSRDEAKAVRSMADRTESDRESNPLTGADLGAGPGAGSTKRE